MDDSNTPDWVATRINSEHRPRLPDVTGDVGIVIPPASIIRTRREVTDYWTRVNQGVELHDEREVRFA